jgi:hypothetical protein
MGAGADELVAVVLCPEDFLLSVGPSADEGAVPTESSPVVGEVFVEVVVEIADHFVAAAAADPAQSFDGGEGLG